MRVILVLIFCLLNSTSWACQGMGPGPGFTVSSSGSETCSSTATIDILGNNSYTGLNTHYYLGGQITPTSNISVCQVDVTLGAYDGDISGKSIYVRLWTLSGTSLDTNIGTSAAVTGDNAWDEEYVAFTFSSSVSLSSSTTYAFTVDQGGVDGTNFITLFYSGSDEDSQTDLRSYDNSGSQLNAWTGLDMSIKFYGTE